MDTFLNYTKLVACVLPFVSLCLLAIKANLPKSLRYVQFPLPVIALVYGFVTMTSMDSINNFLLSLIYQVIERFPILSFLSNINWTYGVMYVTNMALVTGFMALKVAILPPLLAFKSNRTVLRFTAGWSYTYDEEEKRWYLKRSMMHARTVLNWMYIAGLIISSILFVITYHLVSVNTLSAPFYPAFGLIILGEFFFFLNGSARKKEEEEEAAGAAPEEETPEVEYEPIREIYERTFADRISGSFQMPVAEHKKEIAEKQLEKYQEEFETTFSQEARLLVEFYHSRVKDELDDTMMVFAGEIMAGKSVLFMNQFYEDTTDYVFLPVVRHLMRYKKILVILGRSGAEANVAAWFKRGMESVNHFDSLWDVKELSQCEADTPIAILPLKDIYDQKLLQAKAEYLADVSMVFVMDPSRLLSTMQIGLSCVVSFLKKGREVQYIAYDRNCDGLVDSLSHVLGTSIVLVGATAVSGSESGVILWDADGEMLYHRLGMDLARYLGVGTELASLAIRSGVSKVTWLGYQKFPVTEMHWIAEQYYAPLCRSMGIGISQTSFDDHIAFQPDMWSLPKTEHAYLIVEDEYNNQFETARQFATRGTKQSFLHVICQNFWLRDYITDNAEIFRDDPKSIPNIVADYQRSVHNTVYKLIFRLICGKVPEQDIQDMLEVVNVDTDALSKTICRLIQTYFAPELTLSALEAVLIVEAQTMVDDQTFETVRKRYYSIRETEFVEAFFSQLRVSYYLAEDESDRDRYLGSILYGHVYQKYLPGMHTILEGKYYEVVTVTKKNGVVVRRAADHIDGRKYYRPLRTYHVSGFAPVEHAVSGAYGNIVFERGEAHVAVDTIGYLEMQDHGDMCHAKRVTVNHVEQRVYPHKNILRIDLGEECPETVRITIADLLNELFITVFPDTHEYITATTSCSGEFVYDGYFPQLELQEADTCLYIIEDSLIDLGLLINVDRYFVRFLEIICDALNWHTEKLQEELDQANGDGGGMPDGAGDDDDQTEKKEPWIKRVFRRIKEFFKKLFRRKKKKGDDAEGGEEPAEAEDPEATEEMPEDSDLVGADGTGLSDGDAQNASDPSAGPEENALRMSSQSGPTRRSGTVLASDAAEEPDDEVDGTADIEGDDSESITIDAGDPSIARKAERASYTERCYLLYGFDKIPEFLNIEGTLEYLKSNGFDHNYLEQARASKRAGKLKWYNYEFEPGVHYCDFCGKAMEDKIDVLNDGRERCPECSKTAVTKLRQFKKLYRKTRRQMEDVFGIEIKEKIKIKMVDAATIAESLGKTLILTPEFDGRTLGYAYRNGSQREIWLENGAPSMETAKTLVHELTHIWQYHNLPDLFVGDYSLIPIEGMAVWTEVQYLVSIGEEERAQDYIRNRLAHRDEYGEGLARYLDKFPIAHKARVRKRTPFCCDSDPLA